MPSNKDSRDFLDRALAEHIEESGIELIVPFTSFLPSVWTDFKSAALAFLLGLIFVSGFALLGYFISHPIGEFVSGSIGVIIGGAVQGTLDYKKHQKEMEEIIKTIN